MTIIPYISLLYGKTLGQSKEILLSIGTHLSINQVNWPDTFPYAPKTEVYLAHDRQRLMILFSVEGKQLRALALEDQQNVWEDSCVEFFCRIPDEEYYMNFETNCIGTMVASRRLGQNEGIQFFTPSEMLQIERYSSLAHRRMEECDGEFSWCVGLAIPLTLIFSKPLSFPQTLEANFYKCADKTRFPHFVSWGPICSPKPKFHCPEFFKSIVLAE